jgi:hypothetical protein
MPITIPYDAQKLKLTLKLAADSNACISKHRPRDGFGRYGKEVPRILDTTMWRWSSSCYGRLISWERAPRTYSIAGWVCPTTCLNIAVRTKPWPSSQFTDWGDPSLHSSGIWKWSPVVTVTHFCVRRAHIKQQGCDYIWTKFVIDYSRPGLVIWAIARCKLIGWYVGLIRCSSGSGRLRFLSTGRFTGRWYVVITKRQNASLLTQNLFN